MKITHCRLLIFNLCITFFKQTSTKQNVPVLPIPALKILIKKKQDNKQTEGQEISRTHLQCTTQGPTSSLRTPLLRTASRKSRKSSAVLGTPKSGHFV